MRGGEKEKQPNMFLVSIYFQGYNKYFNNFLENTELENRRKNDDY